MIFGPGKTPEQIAAIAERIVAAGHSLLVTRTTPRPIAAVTERVPGRVISRTGPDDNLSRGRRRRPGAARSSSPPPAPPTCRWPKKRLSRAEIMGNPVDRLYDVGVAGLHRLLAEHARLAAARVIIVVAGMEGALPSVVGGLVDVPVIAVPTSVGYGASFGGAHGAARHAEQLRQRRLGRQHRQRIRRRRRRQRHQSSAVDGVIFAARPLPESRPRQNRKTSDNCS